MPVLNDVRSIFGAVVNLGPEAESFERETLILGSIPEFDSMAVVSVIAALEEHFGIFIEDDEITAEVFQTLGSLVDFVDQKLRE